VPEKDYLIGVLKKVKHSWRNEKGGLTGKFAQTAIDVLHDKTIRFLRVSDYNTKGLLGSDKIKDSDWCDLVKASGSSDKNELAGGSFGIGKFAPFVCSDLRTVFYATKDIEGLQATQGISRLVSFQLHGDSEEESQGIGYYGDPEKNMPMNHCQSFQPGYVRDEPGTDMFIAGFRDFDDWEDSIVTEILDGFLYALHMGTLHVTINDIVLSQETLSNIMETYHDVLPVTTKAYYETLTSEKTKWIINDFKNMGEVRLGLKLMDSDAPRKVAMIRNPWMKIKDQSGISGSIPFAGVLVIVGEELNAFLRKIENPQHTHWEPNRMPNKSQIKSARRVLRQFKDFIRDELNDMIVTDGVEQLDMPGAGDILPFDDASDDGKNKETDLLARKIAQIEVKVIKKIKTKQKSKEEISEQEYEELVRSGVIEEGDDIYVSPRGTGHGSETGSSTETPTGSEAGSAKARRVYTVKPQNLRLVSIDKHRNKYGILFALDDAYESIDFVLHKLDEQGGKEKVNILEANSVDGPLNVKENRILGYQPGGYGLQRVDLVVEETEYFTAEVVVLGTKK
jgi:hypothetical protein